MKTAGIPGLQSYSAEYLRKTDSRHLSVAAVAVTLKHLQSVSALTFIHPYIDQMLADFQKNITSQIGDKLEQINF